MTAWKYSMKNKYIFHLIHSTCYIWHSCKTYVTSTLFPFNWIVSILDLWCWRCVLSGQVGNTFARYAWWSIEINYDVSSWRQLHDRRVPGDIASWEVKGKGLPEVCITVRPVPTGKHSSGSLSYFPAYFELFSSSFCAYRHFLTTQILLVLSVDSFCFGYNTHNHVRQEHVIPAVMTGGRKTNWHAPNSSLSLSFRLQTEQRMRDHVRTSHTLSSSSSLYYVS